MKNLFYLFLILAFAACTPKATSSGNAASDNTAENEGPKTLSPSGTQHNDPKVDVSGKRFTVSGKVLYTSGYCGGAAPTPDMEAEAKLPKPRFGQELIVRTGETNTLNSRVLARTTTKEDGSFSFQLPPGEYCIVISQKENLAQMPKNSDYIQVDDDCYKKWMAQCDIGFMLRDRDVTDIKVILHQACFTNSYSTCVEWNGPLPPSAPRGDHN